MQKAIRLFCVILFAGLATHSVLAQTANFTADKTTGCAPLAVNFTNTSTGGATSFNWSFGFGTPSTLPNPSRTYNTPGTYTVTLTVNGGSTKTAVITVYAKPKPNYTATPNPGCVGSVVSFTSTTTVSGGPIQTYTWDFGDGVVQTVGTGNISHTYALSGTFPVSLDVSDPTGCSEDTVINFTVSPKPVAAFTGTPLSACVAPLTVDFTNSSTATGTPTYTWYFGDGQTSTWGSPSNTYNAIGSYNVSLVVQQGGCKDSITKTAYVNINKITPMFTVSTDSVCPGGSVTFTETSTPVASSSRVWSFGDGQTSTATSPSHVYSVSGSYTPKLIVSDANGCIDSVSLSPIVVFPKVISGFSSTATNGCSLPFAVTFTDTSTNSNTYSWSFGDGGTSTSQNPTHNYIVADTFTVKQVVTSQFGCKDSVTKVNYIFVAIPNADFVANPLKGCIPLDVTFSDLSTSPAVPIAAYSWRFGDGNVALNAAPVSTENNTYIGVGVFDVTLIITTATGCVDSITKTGYVRAGTPPNPDFVIVKDTICHGEDIDIANTTFLPPLPNEHLWMFGDGGTSSNLIPTYQYQSIGTFDVTYIAFFNGCPDTMVIVDAITVLPSKPIASTVYNCPSPYTVNFADASVGADLYTWDYGDGSPLDNTAGNVQHTYTATGTYTGELLTENTTTGCKDSVVITIVVIDPVANFTSSNPVGCKPVSVNFSDNSSTGVPGTIANWSWDFGNGSTYTSNVSPGNPPTSITYTNVAQYDVELVITDTHGCLDTILMDNYVNALGIDTVKFSSIPTTVGCAPFTTTLSEASISDSTIVSWAWDFGDTAPDSTAIVKPITHTYQTKGVYSVGLIVTDKNGCTGSLTKASYLTVTQPIASFTVDTFSCKGVVLDLNASASNAADPTYSWDFGDSNDSIVTVNTIQHTYTSDNYYTVSLTVTDSNGCDTSYTQKVRILQPTAAFTFSDSAKCGSNKVDFINTSTGFVTSSAWAFGDGSISALPNPSKNYTYPGYYTVTLIVTNGGGCTDTIVSDSIVVVPGPYGTYSFTPSLGCPPLEVDFAASSPNALQYEWDFGDGNVITTTGNSTTHTYILDTIATPIVSLINTLPGGISCRVAMPTIGNISVVNNLVLTVTPPMDTLTEDESVVLSTTVANVNGAISYSWSPAVGLDCYTCATPTAYATDANITYTVSITEASTGCQDNEEVTIYFKPCETSLVIPNIITPNNDGINDVFRIKGACKKDDYALTVFNRWGKEVYKTDKVKDYWDAHTNSGALVDDGVYYYIITSGTESIHGFFHVITTVGAQ